MAVHAMTQQMFDNSRFSGGGVPYAPQHAAKAAVSADEVRRRAPRRAPRLRAGRAVLAPVAAPEPPCAALRGAWRGRESRRVLTRRVPVRQLLADVLADVCAQLRLPLAQCWSSAGRGAAAALRTRGQPACVAQPSLSHFRDRCCDAQLQRGEGFPGRVWQLGGVVWGDTQALPAESYGLRDAAAAAGLRSAVAVAVARVGAGADAWCVPRAQRCGGCEPPRAQHGRATEAPRAAATVDPP